MESNERFNKLEEIVSEILIDTHLIRTELKGLREGQENSMKVFNSFAEAILGKFAELTDEMKGMRKEAKNFQDHEERIRKIEAHVFQKGA